MKPLRLAAVAIHDVAPVFYKQVAEKTDFLNELGVDFSYLVIPKFHGKEEWDLRSHPGFTNYLVSQKKDLVLHGFLHKKKRFDNEFERLKYPACSDKIENGMFVFEKTFGFKPNGFIPPMWLLSKGTLRSLKENDFDYTVSERFFYDLRRNARFHSAVFPQKNVMILPTALNIFLKAHSGKIVSIAVHPQDGKRKLGVIKRMIGYLRKRGYEFVSYEELFRRV